MRLQCEHGKASDSAANRNWAHEDYRWPILSRTISRPVGVQGAEANRLSASLNVHPARQKSEQQNAVTQRIIIHLHPTTCLCYKIYKLWQWSTHQIMSWNCDGRLVASCLLCLILGVRLDGPRRQHDCWALRQIASLTIHYISEPKDLVNSGNVEHGSKMFYENHYINHIKAIPIQSLSRIPLLLP